MAAFSFRDPNFIDSAYLVASILFILGIRGLAHPRTARQGNLLAAVGMGIAIGAYSARAVKMTAMPQMVALFNGVGGGAVALVALSEFHERIPETGNIALDTLIPTVLACIIGAVSFAGSLIAFAKLQELMTGRPILFPGQQIVNGALLLGIVAAAVILIAGSES